MNPSAIQLDAQGSLKHFLTIEGLSRELLIEILDQTEGFLGIAEQAVKKVPLCRGKIVANLFFETSTRTRTTFELAAKRLSADVLNLDIGTSAAAKGNLARYPAQPGGHARGHVRGAPRRERCGPLHRRTREPPRQHHQCR